jgi:hypothetical protein
MGSFRHGKKPRYVVGKREDFRNGRLAEFKTFTDIHND